MLLSTYATIYITILIVYKKHIFKFYTLNQKWKHEILKLVSKIWYRTSRETSSRGHSSTPMVHLLHAPNLDATVIGNTSLHTA